MRCSGDKKPLTLVCANFVPRKLFVCKTCVPTPKYAQKRQNSTLWHKKPPPFAKFNTIFGRATSSLAPRPYFILSPVGFYAQITYHGRRLRKPNLTLTRLRAERRNLTLTARFAYMTDDNIPLLPLSKIIAKPLIKHFAGCASPCSRRRST